MIIYLLYSHYIDMYKQSMCFVTYLVQVYVDSYMSRLVKVSFTDIWIQTSTMIEKYHTKYVSPYGSYCKIVNIYRVPIQLYSRYGA